MPDLPGHPQVAKRVAGVSVFFSTQRLAIRSARRYVKGESKQRHPEETEYCSWRKLEHQCRFSPRMLRKKLDKTVCSPIVIRVAAGITRRKVLDGSSGPNEVALQKL